MRISTTHKALISLAFSLAVLGAGIFWTWQNIVVPFRSTPPRPPFPTPTTRTSPV